MTQLVNLSLPHSVTSLPDTPSLFHRAVFSTSAKEKLLDATERLNVQQNLQAIENSNCPLKNEAALEQLARGLAYHIGKEAVTIQVPIDGRQITYTIEEIPLWMGINAYGLTPVDGQQGPPILLFRGSSFYPSGRGALATIVADLDPTGVGHLAYKWGASAIKKWFEGKEGVLVTGHSLGGALATYAAIDNRSSVREVHTHGGVGCSLLYKRKFDKLAEPLSIRNFYHPEDKVVHIGQRRIGTDLAVNTPVVNEGKGSWRQKSFSHRMSLLDKAGTISEISPKLKLPAWLQTALLIIPFLAAATLLLITRLLFGSYSHPCRSILGTLRKIWHHHIGKQAELPPFSLKFEAQKI